MTTQRWMICYRWRRKASCYRDAIGPSMRSTNTPYFNGPWRYHEGVTLFSRENSTKTDRPWRPLLVGPHAALCKPTQGPAQLRLNLDQAAPPQLRQPLGMLSHTRSLPSTRPYSLAPPVQLIWTQKASPWGYGQLYADSALGLDDAADWGNTEVAQNWDSCKGRKSGPLRDPGIGLLDKAIMIPFNFWEGEFPEPV
jgi:hypothetical protein